ncbi:MAG: hypothetical protein JXA06_02390 [Bacteroidetes bacterium]|nr:hypothetical protein [Bacteroidota bacterium]
MNIFYSIKEIHLFLVIYILSFLIILLLVPSCKEDTPTQSGEDVCELISVSGNRPTIQWDCNSGTVSSSYTYDEYGNYSSTRYEAKCDNSPEVHNVYFYDIQYNSENVIQSFQATIDGKSCSWHI